MKFQTTLSDSKKRSKKTKTKPISVRLGLQLRNLHFHVNMYLGHKFLKLFFFFKQTQMNPPAPGILAESKERLPLELEATRRHKIQIILSWPSVITLYLWQLKLCFSHVYGPEWDWNLKEKSDIVLLQKPVCLFFKPKQQQQIINTLTSSFVKYSVLVLGWTRFSLHNCLNASWHKFSKVLENIPFWAILTW